LVLDLVLGYGNKIIIMKNVCVLIGLIFVFFGCSKLSGDDDELSLIRKDYGGNELKLNGIFFTEKETSSGFINPAYCLFRNGIIRYGGSNLNNLGWNQDDDKTEWGVFIIDSGIIQFERWYPSSGGPLEAFVRAGTILNDTTFHITESYRVVDGERTQLDSEDEIYRFRALSPKPDSTNVFIK